MNPDHFNNIARNESGLSGVFDMAATAPPAPAPAAAKPAPAPAAAKPAPAQAAAPSTAKQTEAEKAQEAQDAKLRSILKDAKVDDSKIEAVIKKTNDLMKENVSLSGAVWGSLQTYGYTKADANDIALKVLRAFNPPQDDESAKVKPLTEDELDKLITDKVKRVAKDMAQLPANAQPPANPGTPDQQVQAARQAQQAANRPNNPGSEFGSSNGRANMPVPSTPPNQQAPKNQKIFLMSDRTNAGCSVSIEQEDGETIGHAEKVEGKTCPLDKKIKFNASIDDIDAINKIASNLFRDKIDKREKDDDERDEDKAKLNAAKEAWDKAQKRCKGKGMDLEDKMDCVQDNFEKLAEDLDDSTQSKNLLKKAYTSSVAPLLKAAMLKPIVTFDRFGRVIINQEPIVGNQLANNLIDALGDTSNATSIVSDLQRKSMESLRGQATMAQNMYATAKSEQKNPRTMQMGMYKEMASNTFMNQIASTWPDQDLAALVNSVTTGGTYTPGLGGLTTIPQDMADARIRAQTQYRGYNVPAPATFGNRSTINGQFPNQNLSQNQNMMNQNQALPGRGMTRVSGIYTPDLTIP
jgi:hypothetical protein